MVDSILSESRKAAIKRRRLKLLQEQLAIQADQPAEDEPRFDPSVGTGEFLADKAKRGLGLGIGAPVDLLSLIPKPDVGPLPTPGEQPLAGEVLAEKFGFQGLKPPSANAQFGGRMIEEVAATAPFAGLGGPAGLLRRPLANLGLGAASGAGAGLAQLAAPGSLGAEITGQVAGGVLAPSVFQNRVAALRNLKGTAKESEKKLLENMKTGSERAVVGELADELSIKPVGDEFDDVALDLKQQAERRGQTLSQFPEIKPTLGAVTGNPVIAQREANIAARSAKEATERMRIDTSNRLSLKLAADQSLPAPETELSVIARQRRRGLSQEQAKLDRELQNVNQRIEEAATINSINLEDAGKEIRSRNTILVDNLKGQANQKYNAARTEAANSPVVIDPGGTISLFKEYRADPLFDLVPQDMPDIFKRINALVRNKAKEVAGDLPPEQLDEVIKNLPVEDVRIDYKEYDAMRQAVNQDIQVELARTAPNRRRIRALTRMKKRIDGMSGQITEQAPELSRLDKEANDFFRDEVAPKIYRGINRKVSLGEDRLFNDKIIQQYWKPKEVTNIRRFKELYGNDDAANAALEGGVLQLYKDSVIKKGVINAVAHDNFMKRHAMAFDEFPQLRQMLNDRQTATQTLNLRADELAENIDEINNSIWFKHKDFGNKEPEMIVKDALKNPRGMSRIVLAMPKNARESFAASVVTDVYNRSLDTNGLIDPALLKKNFKDNEQAVFNALRHGYGATKARGHLSRLDTIQDAADILQDSAIRTGQIRGSQRTINVGGFETGIPLTTAVSQIRAVQTGRTGIGYVIAVMSGQTGLNVNARQMAAYEKKLLYDPDLSMDLVNAFKDNVKTGKPDINKFKDIFFKVSGKLIGAENIPSNLGRLAPRLGLEERIPEREQ